MKKLTSVSIFFPAYNDARSLPSLITRAETVAKRAAKRYEIIVVNDGSIDDTKQTIRALQKSHHYLRLINHPQNMGYGAALRSGFAAARYEWVFYTDGDGQYDPSELTRLVLCLQKNVTSGRTRLSGRIDVVNGYKVKRSDPLIRTLIGNIYNTYQHMVHRLPIRDIDCDFRLIKKSLLKKITLRSTSGTICVELITKLQIAGATFCEVPVSHLPRTHGHSQFFRPRHLIQTLREFIQTI